MLIATVVLSVLFAAAGFALIGLAARHRRVRAAVDNAVDRLDGGTEAGDILARLERALRRWESARDAWLRERSQLTGSLQVAPLGILVTDADGEIVLSNPGADRIREAHRGEAVVQARLRDAIETVLQTRAPSITEIELYTPMRAVLEVSAVPTDLRGQHTGAAAFVRDVTEARRVDSMRRDFVANVSHELKTPLAALAALAETLSQSVGDGDPKASGLAGRLRMEADRLARLVGDILDLSQAEALPPESDPVEITSLVVSIGREVTSLASEAGVTLLLDAVDPDAVVEGDADQLRSMLFNLVENAIKYSVPEADRTPPTVTVRAGRSDGAVVIEIEDEGIGIADAHLDRVFERFYRIDRARSRNTGGTGLGLAIARHIARRHGGDITLASVEGKGSTFTVTLPARAS